MSTVSDVRAVLDQLDAEIAETQQHLADLQVQRRGAEALLERLPTRATPGRSTPRQGGGGITEIVADVLVTHPERLDLRVIEAPTAERGTPLDNEQVRSAVTYLRRRGDAERVGRGV